MTRSLFFTIAALAGLCAFPHLAGADGGIMVRITHETTTQSQAARDGLVSSNGQRAALVERGEGGWDLYVEPGELRAEAAAWVLPLPVLPEVSAATDDFLDELDAATEPVLIEHVERTTYSSYDEWGGCAGGSGCLGGSSGGSDMGGDGELQPDTSAEPSGSAVTLWGEGRLGDLGYEIVSSESAGALAEWLETNGYAVADGLAERVEPYAQEGYYFVATRFERGEDLVTRLPTMRFTMAELALPEYPMRLTTLSMGDELDFLLWIATRPDGADQGLVPGNCGHRAFTDFEDRAATEGTIQAYGEGELTALYDDGLEAWLADDSPRALAVQFHGQLTRYDIRKRIDELGVLGRGNPLAASEYHWSPEIKDLLARSLVLTRYRGRFAPEGMDEDVKFVRGEPLGEDDGVYERTLFIEEWGDGTEHVLAERDARRRALTAGSLVLALALLGLALGLRGRSRVRPGGETR